MPGPSIAEYLKLSRAAYTPANASLPKPPPGYVVFAHETITDSGMQATAFKNFSTQDIIIA